MTPVGAVETSSLAAVQDRIAQVRQRIATLSGAVPAKDATSSPSGRAATSAGSAAGSAGPLTSVSTAGAAVPGGFAAALSMAAGALAPTAASIAAPIAALAAPPTGVAGGEIGGGVVASAMRHLGVPYAWGGTDPATGLDCSALVQLAMRENGVEVPRTAAQQARVGTEVPSLALAQPGDLVVLRGGSHIGIYVGDGKMVHAPKSGDVVKVADVYETPMTIRRLTGAGSSPPVPALPALADLGGALGGALLRPATLRGLGAALSGTASGAGAHQELFDTATARYGLPVGLLSAVAKVESGYDAGAVSPAGARGLMQIMPGTARELGVDPMVPAQAVDGAARLLSQHLETFGSLPLALAAYNAGAGNVRKHHGVPPFAETQSYVRKVTDAQSRTI